MEKILFLGMRRLCSLISSPFFRMLILVWSTVCGFEGIIKISHFLAASAYNLHLYFVSRLVSQGIRDVFTLSLIWESWVPSKVEVFFSQGLQDRFSSKENLFKRNVIVDPDDISCIIYGDFLKYASHLFVNCILASSV